MLFGGFFFTFMPIVEKLAERYHVYGIVMRFRIFAANCVTAVCGFCCNFAPANISIIMKAIFINGLPRKKQGHHPTSEKKAW